MGITVLSLFDGMSCGQLALGQAGIEIDTYYASEIEVPSIKVTQYNFPNTIQIGDVTKVKYENGILHTESGEFDVGEIDLLIGGSPCQSLSITRSRTREHLDGKSKLFFEYIRILEEVKPTYYLFENVASMNKESKDTMSELFGSQPYFINSNCFVAQDRPRLYWTNIKFDSDNLIESDVNLVSILESKVDDSYYYNYPLLNLNLDKQVCAIMDYKNNDMHKRIFNPKFKTHTLTTCSGGNTQKKVYDIERKQARKLTPLEYERLQGVPDNYTNHVAKTHRYNMLGNGWTIPVIAHIFKGLKNT